MAKFYGKIGFVRSEEVSPGVWKNIPEERDYYGDVIRSAKQWQGSGEVNDNLMISNQISIIADSFVNENFAAMKYVKFMGARWKITNAEVQFPRLLLTLGGIYNG